MESLPALLDVILTFSKALKRREKEKKNISLVFMTPFCLAL